jgi:hypothetical protein
LTSVIVPELDTPPVKFRTFATLFVIVPELLTGQATTVGVTVPADLRMVPWLMMAPSPLARMKALPSAWKSITPVGRLVMASVEKL